MTNKKLTEYGFTDPVHNIRTKIKYNIGGKQMTTIREAAAAYEPKKTRNISELDRVSTELDTEEVVYNEGTPEEYTAFIAVIDGERFRVPKTVLEALKEIITEKPDVTEFRVKKAGEGMNTKYTVITLD